MTELTLVKTVILKASPENVFAYLTQSDLLAKWFQKSDIDLVKGAPYALMSDDHPGQKICWGEVLELDSPTRLVYTFTHNHLKGHLSKVSYDLIPCAGGTKLTLTHEALDDGPVDALEMLTSHDIGWDDHIVKLRQLF